MRLKTVVSVCNVLSIYCRYNDIIPTIDVLCIVKSNFAFITPSGNVLSLVQLYLYYT